MTRQERAAWYTMWVVIAAIVVFSILIPIVGLPRAGAGLSILALIALVPVFYWRRGNQAEVLSDERELAIHSKATKIASAAFWLFFVAGGMGLYAAYVGEGKMPVELLPVFLWLGFSVLYLAQAVAMIVQYRQAGRNANG